MQHTIEVTRDDKKFAQRRLRRVFSSHIINNSVASAMKTDRLEELLSEAADSQEPLELIAIGCQDWIKPSWGDPKKDRLIGPLNRDKPRARRFAQEVASFQHALKTLRIETRIHFSISNIEARLHLALGNMGLVIHNVDARKNIDESTEKLSMLISEAEGCVETFDHMETVRQITGAASDKQLQETIAKKSNPSMREFLDALYAFDLSELPNHLCSRENPGPMWVDIQSMGFADDVISFRKTAEILAPELPVVSPFKNSGNWHSSVDSLTLFPTKIKLLSQLFALPPMRSEAELVNRLQRRPDRILQQGLAALGKENISINDRRSQLDAIHAISLLAFDNEETR